MKASFAAWWVCDRADPNCTTLHHRLYEIVFRFACHNRGTGHLARPRAITWSVVVQLVALVCHRRGSLAASRQTLPARSPIRWRSSIEALDGNACTVGTHSCRWPSRWGRRESRRSHVWGRTSRVFMSRWRQLSSWDWTLYKGTASCARS